MCGGRHRVGVRPDGQRQDVHHEVRRPAAPSSQPHTLTKPTIRYTLRVTRIRSNSTSDSQPSWDPARRLKDNRDTARVRRAGKSGSRAHRARTERGTLHARVSSLACTSIRLQGLGRSGASAGQSRCVTTATTGVKERIRNQGLPSTKTCDCRAEAGAIIERASCPAMHPTYGTHVHRDAKPLPREQQSFTARAGVSKLQGRCSPGHGLLRR